MVSSELRERLARYAGWTTKPFAVCVWDDFEKRTTREEVWGDVWFAPDGSQLDGMGCPDFPNDLSACFHPEWGLMRKLYERDINTRVVIEWQGGYATVEVFGSNPADDDFPTKRVAQGYSESSALAFCLAVKALLKL